MLKFVQRLIRNNNGATAVEYGLILALVVLACVGAITGLGGSTSGMWNNVSNASNNL